MIAVADKQPNVFIDTNAYTALRYPADLVAYVTGRETTKVMFGTNYPTLTADQALRRVDELGLDDDQLERFRSGNARSVFNL